MRRAKPLGRDKGGPLSETATLDGWLMGELLPERLALCDLTENASAVSSKRGEAKSGINKQILSTK